MKKAWFNTLKIYMLFACLTAMACFIFLAIYSTLSGHPSMEILKMTLATFSGRLGVAALCLCTATYLLWRCFIYFRSYYTQSGRTILLRKFGFYTVVPIVILIGARPVFQEITSAEQFAFHGNVTGINASMGEGDIDPANKLRGVHYFSRYSDGNMDFSSLVENNVEHMVLVPYAYQKKYDDPNLRFDRRRRRSNFNRDSLYLSIAQKAAECGLKVMIKPHIWMSTDEGKWRSDINFSDPIEFETWATNYSDFILHYAKLSQEMKASHYCIGTELSSITKNHPEFWRALIREVRRVFHGKLFYAANWYQEYEHINFWSELDYVGIQAYFPICKKDHPTVADLKEGWKPHLNKLRRFSDKVRRPILFSELGYKSTHDAAADPWEWVTRDNRLTKRLSAQTQANCYEAFFQSCWTKPWFAGTLIWQWQAHYDQDKLSTVSSIDFTPQHKPAQEIMAKWFAKE